MVVLSEGLFQLFSHFSITHLLLSTAKCVKVTGGMNVGNGFKTEESNHTLYSKKQWKRGNRYKEHVG